MKNIAQYIEQRIQQDPGNRGLANWAVQNQILPSALSLLRGDHILLATGFYILKAETIETDGPPGALILADTLVKAGKKVTILFDSHSEGIFKAGMKYIDSSVNYCSLDVEKKIDSSELFTDKTTHFIALERPGKAADGKYYNFAGRDISSYHASLDEVFTLSREKNIITIGIGDGGNELGMGLVSDAVDLHIQKKLSCRTSADYCICAGVSNWAGYGTAALISRMMEKNLMQRTEVLQNIIRDIVEAGAVDGVTGKQDITVDGLAASWESAIYNEMFLVADEVELRELAL
ncbi:DUF4392 domain-containing protein [Oceanispirochaeta crateris]|uniref:DUF4392 domain-containing protein n=1 Tax=Oceanispirochaeta crateris TaxID=2518645 RepID=A0A5C1QHI5_9SPIO|nr:glutamate cyclase domain-containing protein [Oceanispirochaeta crateris]QEN06569.1 DUF4392 domain-containing protein [Oceanispirochaeta crateris]